jgi:hypothetical protein
VIWVLSPVAYKNHWTRLRKFDLTWQLAHAATHRSKPWWSVFGPLPGVEDDAVAAGSGPGQLGLVNIAPSACPTVQYSFGGGGPPWLEQ